jgi:hypothetical protein
MSIGEWDKHKMKACRFCSKIIYMYQVRGRNWSKVIYCDEHCAYEGRILETRITANKNKKHE